MKIVVFEPFANISSHAIATRYLAHQLSTLNHEIKLVSCIGYLSKYCISMSESKLSFQSNNFKKNVVCRACRKRNFYLNEEFNLDFESLDSYLESDLNQVLDNLTKDIKLDNWFDFSISNIPIAKYSAYEFFLEHKISSLDIPESLFPELLSQIRNGISTYFATKNFFEQETVDAVLVYNDLYSTNRIFCAVAKANNLKTFSIQPSPMLLTGMDISLSKSNKSFLELANQVNQNIGEDKIKISKSSSQLIRNYFLNLKFGSAAHAYSKPRDYKKSLRLKFELSSYKKVALVALSSEDEYYAADFVGALPEFSSKQVLFENQSIWIEEILRIAKEFSDIAFCIRLHPRMFPNKRESKMAPQVAHFMEILSKKTSNVFIDSPDLEISIYDYLDENLIALPRTSSVGAQFALFGVPVILPGDGNLFAYPSKLGFVANSISEYKLLILKNFDKPEIEKRIGLAVAWYFYLSEGISRQVVSQSKFDPKRSRPKSNKFFIKIWNLLAFYYLNSGSLNREKASLSVLQNVNFDRGFFNELIINNWDLSDLIKNLKMESKNLLSEQEITKLHLEILNLFLSKT